MAKPMTKTQLAAALADKMESDKKSAAAALDAIVSIITEEVSGGALDSSRRWQIYCRERPARMWQPCHRRADPQEPTKSLR